MTNFNKFLMAVTGDNYDHLKNFTPRCRKKANGIALLILMMTVIWFVSGFMIANSLLGKSVFVSLVVGVVCAFVIFIIERSIVTIEGGKATAAMRLIIAFAVAIISANMIDAIIFKDDVERYMKEKYHLQAENAATKSASKFEQSIAMQQQAANASHIEWQMTVREFNKEINGDGGTRKPGYDKAAQAKEKVMDLALAAYNNQDAQLQELKRNKDAEARAQYDQTLSEMGVNTLFHRITNLHELVFSSWVSGVLYVTFFVFILCLELIVISIKMFSKKTPYEKMLDLNELTYDDKIRVHKSRMEYYNSLSASARDAHDYLNSSRHFN